ncbi:putative acetyltransferase [Anaerobiospirillum thomasii]|uniref:GNAT family N-acetyltransferase n=1 Tax=Anaerobiospirillum thomasii TaxID=179995 RepID=UPI000D9BF823|nr:GNAT family N-acetyltransferase [Anaerobiospirillum thomasii]SPT68378.1 putative acetyltransferase [Anaerobiospirillum thomasii]
MSMDFESDFSLQMADEASLEQCIRIISEVSDTLLDKLFNRIDIKKAMLLVSQNGSDIFNCDNIYLVKARADGQIAAMLFAYKVLDDNLPLILRSMLNKERFNLLKKVMLSGYKGSFYINTVYVNEKYQGQGLGSLLMELAKAAARDCQCKDIFLHCYADNSKALGMYEKYDFKVHDSISYEALPSFKHEKGYILRLEL